MILIDSTTGERTEAQDSFILEQGTDQREIYRYRDADGVPVSLTGYTARAHFRRSLSDAETVIELTTENGGIELEAEEDEDAEGSAVGMVALVFTPADSTGADWRRLVSDVELIDAEGKVSRLIKLRLTLSREVTREA